MKKEVTVTHKYVSFITLLQVLLIGLKLAGVGQVATWSWLWVLAPAWLPFAFVIVIIVLALCVAGIVELFKD